jgi:hypothetical protein
MAAIDNGAAHKYIALHKKLDYREFKFSAIKTIGHTIMTSRKTKDSATHTSSAAGADPHAASAFTFNATQDQVRGAMETGLQQLADTADKAKAQAQKSGVAFEGTMGVALAHAKALHTASVSAFEANTASLFAFANAMIKARTFSDVIEIQTSHARKTMEAMVSQGKDIAGIAQKGLTETSAKAKALLAA